MMCVYIPFTKYFSGLFTFHEDKFGKALDFALNMYCLHFLEIY